MAVIQLPALEAPPRTPLKGTLFDAASVVDGLPIGMMMEVDDLYESWACQTNFNRIVDACHGGTPGPKVFESVPWSSSLYLTAYLGATCKGPGFDYPGAPAKLAAQYEALESRIVAEAVTGQVAGSSTDLGTHDVVTALGLLEGHAGRYYAGAPTILMGRQFLAPLANQLVVSGNQLFTIGGSKVAADGDGPVGKSAVMCVTGEIIIRRGDLINADALNTSTNDFSFLAERAYLVSYDCLDAHVTVGP